MVIKTSRLTGTVVFCLLLGLISGMVVHCAVEDDHGHSFFTHTHHASADFCHNPPALYAVEGKPHRVLTNDLSSPLFPIIQWEDQTKGKRRGWAVPIRGFVRPEASRLLYAVHMVYRL